MFSLRINGAKLDAKLARIISALQNRAPFIKSWGLSVAKLARANALSHSKGGKFWREIADQVRMTRIDDGGATIQCLHFAGWHKHHGGIIRPRTAAALTIPISQEAVGRRAAEFAMGGRQLFVPKGNSVLGYSDGDGGFKALFLHRKSVTQQPEPWWPEDEEVAQLGIREANWWLKKQLES